MSRRRRALPEGGWAAKAASRARTDDDNTGGVASNHLPGSTIALTSDNGPSGMQRRNLTVEQTHIFVE
ncbi:MULTISPECIES: hypothetical protein [Sorangium]|uniref:hypothetical protein n=1 Tax=Sorangium TaxID=39643 RepID=UPI003D9C0F80